MRFGIHLPQYGRAASGEAIAIAARHAEELGFDDPQGMDPSEIADERAGFEDAGIQHVISAPWRSDLASWLRSMDQLAEVLGLS